MIGRFVAMPAFDPKRTFQLPTRHVAMLEYVQLWRACMDSSEPVAKRLECDDKARFEGKPGKLAKTEPGVGAK